MRKIIGLITGILGIILTSVGILVIFNCMNDKSSIGIIGGADGPTAIFIAYGIGCVPNIIGIIAGIMLIVISGILIFKKRR